MADVEVTEGVKAAPLRLYELIADLPRMGEWSPENTGGKWLGGTTGPATGARFRGTNRHGVAVWMTTVTVTAADPGRRFAFEVDFLGVPISRWEYTFADDA
ncbi:MAG TPA: SRPBCC family protein, partial [Mycobacteriales bacterium]|nr:SRPBCC family protein [Mycobacteriales bacterium]